MARASVAVKRRGACAASVEHTHNLRTETGAHFALISPSKMRDRPVSQVEAVVRIVPHNLNVAALCRETSRRTELSVK